MADDDLDLRTLSDDELIEQMHDDLYDGLKEEVEEGVLILLERGFYAAAPQTSAWSWRRRAGHIQR